MKPHTQITYPLPCLPFPQPFLAANVGRVQRQLSNPRLNTVSLVETCRFLSPTFQIAVEVGLRPYRAKGSPIAYRYMKDTRSATVPKPPISPLPSKVVGEPVVEMGQRF